MEVIWAKWGYSGSHAGHEATWGCQCTNAILETKESIWLNPQAASMLFCLEVEHFEHLVLCFHWVVIGCLLEIFSPLQIVFSHPFATISALDLGLKCMKILSFWLAVVLLDVSSFFSLNGLKHSEATDASRKHCPGHAHCKNELFIPSIWIKSYLNI